MWLLIPFIVVPILEIALFIQIGGAIGLWPTLAIVVLTAIAGTILMRVQGLAVLGRLQDAVQQGANPTGPIAHGALILVAGVLLLTPGFFTDGVGFALLIPLVRDAVIRYMASRVAGRMTIHTAGHTADHAGMQAAHRPGETTIDGEYSEVDEDGDRPSGNSGWTRPH